MTDEIIELNEGFQVPKHFFDCIFFQVSSRLTELKTDKTYTAKKLCGNELWLLLTNGERRLAGRCIASMVATGVLSLELEFVESKHEYPKHYRLK